MYKIFSEDPVAYILHSDDDGTTPQKTVFCNGHHYENLIISSILFYLLLNVQFFLRICVFSFKRYTLVPASFLVRQMLGLSNTIPKCFVYECYVLLNL